MTYPFFLTRLLVRCGVARFFPAARRLTDGGGAFLRYYSDRVLAAPYPDVRAAAACLDVHGPDAIDLASAEPRFDLAPSGSTKLPTDRRGTPSPWGLPELRTAIAGKLGVDSGLDVRPDDEVLVTAGAAGAFSLAVDAFVNPGHKVVLLDPTSPLYPLVLQQRRTRIGWVPTWVENGRLRFHLGPFLKELRGARLVVVNSPANPTGAVLAAEDLEQIAWWADRRDVLLFSDEVFERFHYEGARVSLGSFPRARHRTLTAGSVSKGYALASARVGWLAGHRHLVRPCALTALLQASLVPTLCQQVALSALQQSPDTFRPIRDELASRRQYSYERLQAMGLKPTWPAGGMFLWVSVREMGLSGTEFAERLYREKKVRVWPGEHFGPGGAGHVRVSYATDDGRLRQGLGRLGEFVKELLVVAPPEAAARAA